MAKYLKDMKKRELSLDKIEHYRRVAKVIEMTIEVQEEVEEAIGYESGDMCKQKRGLYL